MNIGILNRVGIILVFIWNLLNLCLGLSANILISESRDKFTYQKIIDDKHTDDLNNGCNVLWKSLTQTQFLQIFEGVGLLFCYGYFIFERYFFHQGFNQCLQRIQKCFCGIMLHFIFVQYFITIWIGYGYTNTTSVCYNFWIQGSPGLWNIVIIQYINLWLLVTVTVLMIFRLIKYLCTVVPVPERHQYIINELNDEIQILNVQNNENQILNEQNNENKV